MLHSWIVQLETFCETRRLLTLERVEVANDLVTFCLDVIKTATNNRGKGIAISHLQSPLLSVVKR